MKINKLFQPYIIKNFQINSLFAEEKSIVIYFPEIGKRDGGKIFVNRLRKKGIFNEVLIPPLFIFLNRKLTAYEYLRSFKEINPNIRVVSKFKTIVNGKINLIDLSILSELYFLQLKAFSKYKVTYELLNVFNQFINEYKKIYPDSKFYLLIEASDSEFDNHFIKNLFHIAKNNGFKLKEDLLKIDSGLIFRFFEETQEFKFYPILQKEKELIFKINSYIQFQKDYKNDIYEFKEEDKIDTESIKEEVREKIIEISEKFLNNKKDFDQILNTNSQQEMLDSIYELIHSLSIEGDTPIEKLNNLFKDKDEKIKEKIKKLLIHLDKINKKFNGVIKLNYKLINESSNSYYKTEKIIKLNELTGYKKHENEFDDILDHAMFDLIKSIEKDKEAGIKVLNIKTEIYDTNKSRYKKYIITFKNSDTENKNIYTREIIVPYPIKGKYFKIDGVNYIMINQFFPKPIIKVKPNMVRLYTHFSTFTVSLTTHIINETQDVDEFINVLIKLNKKAKINFIERDNLNKIIDDFGLESANINLISKKIEF